MTDFLTSLAAKSLGQAPVVRPRLLSRFETAAPTVARWSHQRDSDKWTSAADADGARHGWQAEARTPPPFAPPSPRDPAHPQGPVTAREVARAGSSGHAHDPIPLPAQVAGSPQSRRSESSTEKPKPSAVPVVPTATADQPPAPHRSRREAATPEARVAGPVDPTMPTPATPLFAAPRPAVARSSVMQLAVSPANGTESINARARPHIPDERRAVAHAWPNKPTAWPASGAEDIGTRPGPLVRVSIGRIEVRAVTLAAAAPRRRAGPRVAGPSLDEYLKERGGGP